MSEAFVRSIHRGASLRAGESATAWFYRLLRNALVDLRGARVPRLPLRPHKAGRLRSVAARAQT